MRIVERRAGYCCQQDIKLTCKVKQYQSATCKTDRLNGRLNRKKNTLLFNYLIENRGVIAIVCFHSLVPIGSRRKTSERKALKSLKILVGPAGLEPATRPL